MTATDLITIATAMRELGARKVEVHADGGLSVEFGAMLTPVALPDDNGFVNDKRKLPREELERLAEEADNEYIPGN